MKALSSGQSLFFTSAALLKAASSPESSYIPKHWNTHCYITVTNTCRLCSSLERKAPDMKRLSRPLRSSRRREVRWGRRASREASVMLLPGRAKLSNFEPKHRPTSNGRKQRETAWKITDAKGFKLYIFKQGKYIGIKWNTEVMAIAGQGKWVCGYIWNSNNYTEDQ